MLTTKKKCQVGHTFDKLKITLYFNVSAEEKKYSIKKKSKLARPEVRLIKQSEIAS